jgi:hypothetical protein
MLCEDLKVGANKLTVIPESHSIGPSHDHSFVYTAGVIQSKCHGDQSYRLRESRHWTNRELVTTSLQSDAVQAVLLTHGLQRQSEECGRSYKANVGESFSLLESRSLYYRGYNGEITRLMGWHNNEAGNKNTKELEPRGKGVLRDGVRGH